MKYIPGYFMLFALAAFILYVAVRPRNNRQEDIQAAHKDIASVKALEDEIRHIRINQQQLIADAEFRIDRAKEEK